MDDEHPGPEPTTDAGATPPGPPCPCPRCGRDLPGRRCEGCGLELSGPQRATLDRIQADRAALLARRRSAAAELAAIDDELAELATERIRLGGAPPPPAAAPVAATPIGVGGPVGPFGDGEWQPRGLRTWLLVLGVGLLLLAGIAFVAVAWPDLDDAQRAGVLALATSTAAGLAGWLRTRLTATAEALGLLTLALLLVDWGALRRAGVAADLDATWWWAGGQALVAAVGVAAHRVGFRAPLVTSPVLVAGSASTAVLAVASEPWHGALGASLIAAAAVVGAAALGAPALERARRTCEVVAALSWALAVTVGGAELAGRLVDPVPQELPRLTLGPSAAVAASALAPILAAVGLPRVRRELLDQAVATATMLLVAALCGVVGASHDLVTVVAAGGLCGVVALVVSRRGPVVLHGLLFAGVLLLVPAATVTLVDGTVALLLPLDVAASTFDGSLADPVATVVDDLPTGSARPTDDARRAGLAALVLLGIGSSQLRGRQPWHRRWAVALGATTAVLATAAGAISLGDPAAWVPVATALGTALALAVGAVVAGRRVEPLGLGLLALGAVAAVPAIGWSLIDPDAAWVVLAALASLAGVVAAVPWSRQGRAAAAVAGVGLLASATWAGLAPGWTSGDEALRAVLAIELSLLVGVGLWRRREPDGPAVELAALVGAVPLGLSVAPDADRFAPVLSVVTLSLAIAAVVTARRGERALAPLLAAVAGFAWLDRAGVEVVEAYTTTIALGVLGSLLWSRGGVDGRTSGQVLGLPLLLGLGPAVVHAAVDPGQLRPTVVALVCLALVGAGVRWQLRAPIESGTLGLVVLGIDTLGPLAAELPRWVSLGGAGIVVLWLGATVERRMADVRDLRDRLGALG